MERRTVRIYKAPDGQGKYINKISQFLKKAQMGAETRSESVMENKKLEPLIEFISGALDNDMEPENIMKLLVSKGLPKELVYSIISNVVEERDTAAEEESSQSTQEETKPEELIGQSEYQPIGEEEQPVEEDQAMDYFNSYADEPEPVIEEDYQDGGTILSYSDLGNNEESEDTYDLSNAMDNVSKLKDYIGQYSENNFNEFGKPTSDYMGEYTPVEWNMVGDSYGSYKKGGSKKNFTKNVLALVKKAEGGDTQEIGHGVKDDTITNNVSKIKSSFVNKLKEVSNKAAIDSIYEKMMNSNDPELIQSAQELAQKRQQNSQMGSFEPIAQQGGYIGEGQPDMFAYGGFDLPEAKKGFAQRLGNALLGEKYIVANNPYNVKTGALYKDPLTGLTPVARIVRKKGLFGRPKEWTDIYTNAPQRIEIKEQNQPLKNPKNKGDLTSSNLKHAGLPDDVWNDLSFKAKHAIRKGDRQAERNERRYNKQLEKDKEFENFGNGRKGKEYLFAQDKDLRYHLKHNDDKVLNWEPNPHDYKHPSQKQDPYMYTGSVWQTHNGKGEKLKNKEEVIEQATDFIPNDPRFDNDQLDKELATNRYGGLNIFLPGGSTNNPGTIVKKPSDATSMAGELQLPTNPNSFASISQHFMNQNAPINKDPEIKTYTVDPNMNPNISHPDYNTIGVDHKRHSNIGFNGEKAVNVFNAGAQGVLGFINRRQQAKQERDFLENNFTADNIYAHSSDQDRGDWVDYGSQLGQYRFDQMGQSANGRFSYGQSGGFMQEGEMTEGDEVEMTKEELADFLANGGKVEYLES